MNEPLFKASECIAWGPCDNCPIYPNCHGKLFGNSDVCINLIYNHYMGEADKDDKVLP